MTLKFRAHAMALASVAVFLIVGHAQAQNATVTTPGLTPGKVPVATGTATLGDSVIMQSSPSKISIGGGLSVSGAVDTGVEYD